MVQDFVVVTANDVCLRLGFWRENVPARVRNDLLRRNQYIFYLQRTPVTLRKKEPPTNDEQHAMAMGMQ